MKFRGEQWFAGLLLAGCLTSAMAGEGFRARAESLHAGAGQARFERGWRGGRNLPVQPVGAPVRAPAGPAAAPVQPPAREGFGFGFERRRAEQGGMN